MLSPVSPIAFTVLAVIAVICYGNALYWKGKYLAQTPTALSAEVGRLTKENIKYRKEVGRLRKDLAQADAMAECEQTTRLGQRRLIVELQRELERVTAKLAMTGEGRGEAAEVVGMN